MSKTNRIAVIDIGSNTIRLCAFDVSKKSDASQPKITRVFDAKETVGLASFMEQTAAGPLLTEAGIQHAIKTIRKQVRRAGIISCQQTYAFATAAIRNCVNTKSAVREIEDATGTSIDVIPGETEARLGLAGARLADTLKAGVLIDVGGGSTEVSCFNGNDITFRTSVPDGSLTLFSQHVAGIIPTAQEFENMRAAYQKQLDKAGVPPMDAPAMFGIGGSVRAAARVYGDVFMGGLRPAKLLRSHVQTLIRTAIEKPDEFSHELLQSTPQRVHTVMPGCVIIATLMDEMEIDALQVVKHGVREGYVVSRLAEA